MVNYACAFSQSELGKYFWMNNKRKCKGFLSRGLSFPPNNGVSVIRRSWASVTVKDSPYVYTPIWCGRQLSDDGESVSFGLKLGIFKHVVLASLKWETLQCGNLRSGPILAASIYSLLRGRAKIGPDTKSLTLLLLRPDFSHNADWSFKQCQTIWLAVVRFAFPARILFVKRKENRAWSQVTNADLWCSL